MWRNGALSSAICLIAATLITPVQRANAQGIENVLVETYHVTPAANDSAPPLITYRIYIDLAEGYRLQMVYGDERHHLRINTTTDFFNDVVNGGKFAHEIDGDLLNTSPLALDSWLTIGTASSAHMAVPRHLDTDGSILECAPYNAPDRMLSGMSGARTTPLCVVDGLKADTAVKEIVNFKFASGFLLNMRGNELETTDGAWAALGGASGATEENMVLIGQFTTTGTLSFELNVQVGAPDRRVERYVARNAGTDEILFEGLLHGKPPYRKY